MVKWDDFLLIVARRFDYWMVESFKLGLMLGLEVDK